MELTPVITSYDVNVEPMTGGGYLVNLGDARFRLTPSAALVLLSQLSRKLVDDLPETE